MTLRFPDPNAHSQERDEVKTYSEVTQIYVQPDTGFLVIITRAGDFSFDPSIWKSFIVSRDPEDKVAE